MKKIFIIEDDLVTARAYAGLLQDSGFEVQVAHDGESAISSLKTAQPDLVLLDLMLPKVPGTEVLRSIRANPAIQTVPVIVFTNAVLAAMVKVAKQAGADHCVTKSECSPDQLLELVCKTLNVPLPTNGEAVPVGAPPPAPPIAAPAASPAQPSFAPAAMPAAIPVAAPAMAYASASPSRPAPMPSAPTPVLPSMPVFTPPVPKMAPPPPAVMSPKAHPSPMASAGGFPGNPNPPTPPARGYSSSVDPAPAALPAYAPATSGPIKRPDAGGATAAPQGAGESIAGLTTDIRETFLAGISGLITAVRTAIPVYVKGKDESEYLPQLYGLYQTVHGVSITAGMAGFNRIASESGALEALLKEMFEDPATINASSIRTIGSAAELLALLFERANYSRTDTMIPALVLVVDDEAISRRAVCSALEIANLKAVSVDHPDIALRLCYENQFNLIFSDVEMPGKTGFELCAEVRNLPMNKATPFIFVTSLSGFENRARSALSGGNDLIAKPFLLTELAVKALTYLIKSEMK